MGHTKTFDMLAAFYNTYSCSIVFWGASDKMVTLFIWVHGGDRLMCGFQLKSMQREIPGWIRMKSSCLGIS